MTSYKRRNYFIDKRFQAKYILFTLLLLITFTLLFVVILFAPHLLSLASDLPLAEQAQSAKSLLLLHKHVWPAIGIVMLIMSVLSIFISHKIAGPAYRLNKELTEAIKGDLSRTIKLREGDDLQDVAGQVNSLVTEFRTFVSSLRADHALLAEHLVELEAQIGAKSINQPSAQEVVARLKEQRESIQQTLEKFRTEV